MLVRTGVTRFDVARSFLKNGFHVHSTNIITLVIIVYDSQGNCSNNDNKTKYKEIYNEFIISVWCCRLATTAFIVSFLVACRAVDTPLSLREDKGASCHCHLSIRIRTLCCG